MDLADKLTDKAEKVLTKYGSRWKKRCILGRLCFWILGILEK